MKQILVIKEKCSDGTFDVYCKDYHFVGGGDTLEDAIEDMKNQMYYYKDTCTELSLEYPEFLDEPFELVIL